MDTTRQQYQFSLDRSPRKFQCPACEKRRFVRYVDKATGEYLPPKVGRCDREQSCGYHFAPNQWFAGQDKFGGLNHRWNNAPAPPTMDCQFFMPTELVPQTLRDYGRNNFVQFLKTLFHDALAMQLVKRFHIGTSKKWPGATVFWQLDNDLRTHAGKVMLFNPVTGSRVKSPFNHITWVHTLLQQQGRLQDFELQQCLFGLHQLSKGDNGKTVAIVESEKTAVLMTPLMPDCSWLACGGLNNLKGERLEALKANTIVLYPDLGAFEKWKTKSDELLGQGFKVHVSDLLEKNATARDRENGFDLADFLIKRDSAFGWAIADGGYPLFWDSFSLSPNL